jgi:hypothetical protein
MNLNPSKGPPNFAWVFVVVIVMGAVMALLGKIVAIVARLAQ